MTAQEAFSDPHTARLLEALKRSDYAAANRELAQHANVNAVGTQGISPLLWIIGETLDPKRAEYLLKAGADPNYQDESTKASAMYIAAGGSNTTALLELLLKYGGNPSLVGPRHDSLLMTAIDQRRDEHVKLLVQHGADVNWVNPPGEDAATVAVSLARFDLAMYFVEHGLNDARLKQLAHDVSTRPVPAHSEGERRKEQLIALLESRGFQVPSPRK